MRIASISALSIAIGVMLLSCANATEDDAAEPPNLIVTLIGEAPGMTTEEVASQISYPIEAALVSLAHVKKVRSASRPGRATIWVEYARSTDLYKARQSVAGRLKETTDLLPDRADVMLAPPSSRKVLLIVLHAPATPVENRYQRASRMRDFADFTLRPRLLTVPGVSDVNVTGGLRKRYEVSASQDELIMFDITLWELANAIKKANATPPAPQTPENKEAVIRSSGDFRTEEELANTVVVTRENFPVMVRDLADVRLVRADDDGQQNEVKDEIDATCLDGVMLAVSLEPDIDAKSVSKKIDESLTEVQNRLPTGIKMGRTMHGQLDALVAMTMQHLGRDLPPGMKHQRRSTKQLGDHLIAAKTERAVVKLIGPDVEVVRSMSDEVLARLQMFRGVTDLQVDPQADIPQIAFEIDRQKAARFGVSFSKLRESASLATAEPVIARIRSGSSRYDIVIKTLQTVRDVLPVDRLRVRNATGETVPLRELTKIMVKPIPPVIHGENLQRVVFISFGMKDREKVDLDAEVDNMLRPVKQSLSRLDEEYRIQQGW